MTPDYWLQATQELTAQDPVLGRIIASYEGEMLESQNNAFYTLARAITGQQISVKAADSIWARLIAACQPEFTPSTLLHLSDEALRACGFSGAKTRYLHSLAQHFSDVPDYDAQLQAMDEEDALKSLIQLKGVGRWTAEMLLIFHLLKPDVLPLDDIGLLKAIYLHYNQGEKMPLEAVKALSEQWRPWRSVATWYFWRSLDPVPVVY